MKIVFYISSLDKGGAERVLSNLANYFANIKNNDVYLVLERPTINYSINSNVKTIILEKNNRTYNFVTKKIRYIGYICKLKKIFKKIKPDIIIPFLTLPAFMALICRNKNSKVIVGIRNDPKTEYTTYLKRKMMKKLYPKADGFIFQTKEAQEYFKNIISCRQKIIYNAVSEEFINYKKPIKRKKKIIAVGRLHEQKNYPLLIEAFTEISKKYTDYELIIYGDGPEKEKIKNLVLEAGLEKKVTIAGNVDDVKKNIYDASIYIMTSNFEGMPNSLIEAMILGLPVISTDCPCGGPRELIENNKNGILISINNKNELVQAIDKLLGDRDFAEKIGNEARNLINKVEPKIINNEWKKFISDIVNDN